MLASLSLALLPLVAPGPRSGEVVAVRAGTIHVVADGRTIEGGGTLLLRDGKVAAVGKTGEVELPAGARVVDYGADAVIAPGFVAADSGFGRQVPSERTADPGVRAADNFDTYASYASTLSQGVTSAYVPPARGRLVAGQGAVVKLAGGTGEERFLAPSAAIEGSISADARRTPGYWEPPIPATVDVGLGVEQKQLPRTTMGAILALRELLALAAAKADQSDEYGPLVGGTLAKLVQENKPWRMRGETEGEIRALLSFFGENGLPLVVSGASQAGEVADEIAHSGASVVWNVPIEPNGGARDRGKGEDDRWPDYDVGSKLARAKVRFAIAPARSASQLRFAAALAMRGGLSAADALRAITQVPAEILGVADRVGSLAPGRDADLVVMNGEPMGAGSSVVATWVDGEIAWKAHETEATVISVDELHVGDGEVLAPGELLLQDGRIAEVGRRVSRPNGCTVVTGRAAMPGMIDAHGYLGLEGSSKAPPARFEMKRVVEPGDSTDRRVAAAGVTTVVLSSRGSNSSGTPAMAYKPAGVDLDTMVVADPAALVVQWSPERRPNRFKAGESVRELLSKGVDYKKKWDEYEKAISEWTPPPPEPPKEEKADEDKKKDEDSSEKKEGDESEDKKEGDKDKESAEESAPKSLTGTWETQVPSGRGDETVRLRIRLLDEGEGELEGTLRCDAVSDELVTLEGKLSEGTARVSGIGTRGRVEVEASVKEPEKKKDKKSKKKKDGDEAAGEETSEASKDADKRRLAGKLTCAGNEIAFEAPQTSEDYPVARRPELRKEKSVSEKEPKGKPKPPGVNADLEPVRKALEGRGAIVVEVHRSDEILACVKAFEDVGIRPILFGADEAHEVAKELRGRVAGVLLDSTVVSMESDKGTERRNRFAELQNAGIPVAFQSSSEEGAADLPVIAAYAVSEGMSPAGALRALTGDAATMFHIESRVGRLARGADGDVLLLDGSPLTIGAGVVRVWVAGREIRTR